MKLSPMFKTDNKADIQETLDEIVKDYKASMTITTYYGVPMTEFTHEELIAVIHKEKGFTWKEYMPR